MSGSAEFDASAAAEFADRVGTQPAEQRGDSVELEHGDDREPMTLIANAGTPRADVRLLMMRLEAHGYEIGREHDGEHTTAFTVYHPGYGGERR